MRIPVYLSLGFATLATACVTDSVDVMPSEHGRWVVVSATRANQPTNTLDAAYFVFDTNQHTLQTNFIGEEVTLDYQQQAEVFVTRGSDMLTGFKVTKLTDSSMALQTVIRGTQFGFDLAPERLSEELH